MFVSISLPAHTAFVTSPRDPLAAAPSPTLQV
jgi:hypothetical protein